MKKKSIVSIILTLVMVLCLIPASNVQAATPKIDKKLKFYVYNSDVAGACYSVYIDNPTKKGKITKLKNSDDSVANVFSGGADSFMVEPKSEGTTKVTFKYAGKNFKTKIVVKKWESPCKVFKVGKKNYTKYFKKMGGYNLNKQKKDKSEKIKIVPKSGWKLVKISKMFSGEKEKVKNNSKVKLSVKSTGTGIYARFKNKKTGETKWLYFGYSSTPMKSESVECDDELCSSLGV